MKPQSCMEVPDQGFTPDTSSGVRGGGNICLFPDLHLPFFGIPDHGTTSDSFSSLSVPSVAPVHAPPQLLPA